MLETLISDAKERALHLGTIHDLVSESGLAEEDIARVYEQELKKLWPAARVKDFLPVLIRRVVKENLRRSGER